MTVYLITGLNTAQLAASSLVTQNDVVRSTASNPAVQNTLWVYSEVVVQEL